MGKLFISYRRDDASGYARAIYQHLARHFGADAIFMDVESLSPGRDFVAEIHDSLAETSLILVLIGKDWIDRQADGRARIDDSRDFVRLEVALGLEREIPVLPILLGDAAFPAEAEVPDDLKGLLRRNAVRVTHPRFAADMESVVSVAAEALGVASGWGKVKTRVGGGMRTAGQRLRAPPESTGCSRLYTPHMLSGFLTLFTSPFPVCPDPCGGN